MLKINQNAIDAVKAGKFFNHKFTNQMAECVIHYLLKGYYKYLVNPDPVNPDKNTLLKHMDYFKVIDNFVNKPLNEYEQKDMMEFIGAYRTGKIRNMKNGEKLSMSNIRRYIGEFKKFWKIYRQYELGRLGKDFDQLKFEWGIELKAPKVKKEYEDYPYLELPKLLDIANNLYREEYTVRMIVALNLMGRKCELTKLQMKQIDFRDDNSIWIKLPNVKKNSNKKVPVELYNYAKKPFIAYLKKHDFQPDDFIFPSKPSAFNENLKDVSQRILKKDRLTSRTLRKLGVCVAEQLDIKREDVERVGGWSPNSPVLAHYFKRKGVEAKEISNTKVDREVNKDAYMEIDQMKVAQKKKDEELEAMRKEMAEMNKKNEEHLKHMELMLQAIRNPLTQGDIDVNTLMEDGDKYRSYIKHRKKMKKEGLIQ
jgi:integrase